MSEPLRIDEELLDLPVVEAAGEFALLSDLPGQEPEDALSEQRLITPGEFWEGPKEVPRGKFAKVLRILGDDLIEIGDKRAKLSGDEVSVLNLFIKMEDKRVQQGELDQLLPDCDRPVLTAMRLRDMACRGVIDWYKRRKVVDWGKNEWGLRNHVVIVDDRDEAAEQEPEVAGPRAYMRYVQLGATVQPAIFVRYDAGQPVGKLIGGRQQFVLEDGRGDTAIFNSQHIDPTVAATLSNIEARAFATMEPTAASVMRERYAWAPVEFADDKSVAEKLGLAVNTVELAGYRGEAEIARIVPAIADGTMDYAAYVEDGVAMDRQYTALVLLSRLGVEIPLELDMAGINKLATDYINGLVTVPEREKEMIAAQYSLAAAAGRQEVAQTYQTREDTVRQVADRTLKRLVGKGCLAQNGDGPNPDLLPADDPAMALTILREAMCQKKLSTMGGANYFANHFADVVVNKLIDGYEDEADEIAEFLGNDNMRQSVIFITRMITRYTESQSQSLEDFRDSGSEITILYLRDVAELKRIGLGAYVKASKYITPDMYRSLLKIDDEYKLGGIQGVVNRNLTDPEAGVVEYANKVTDGRRHYAKDIRVTDQTIKYYARRRGVDIYPEIEGWLERRDALIGRYEKNSDITGHFLGEIARLMPSDPEMPPEKYMDELVGVVEESLENMRELRKMYDGDPDFAGKTIATLVRNHRSSPYIAAKQYASTLEATRLRFEDEEDVEDYVLRFFSCNYPSNPQAVANRVGEWLESYRTLRTTYQYHQDITADMIRDAALMYAWNPAFGMRLFISARSKSDRIAGLSNEKPVDRQPFLANGSQQSRTVDDPQELYALQDERDARRAVIDRQLQGMPEADRIAVLLAFGLEDADSLGLTGEDLGRLCQLIGTADIVGYVEREVAPKLRDRMAS